MTTRTDSTLRALRSGVRIFLGVLIMLGAGMPPLSSAYTVYEVFTGAYVPMWKCGSSDGQHVSGITDVVVHPTLGAVIVVMDDALFDAYSGRAAVIGGTLELAGTKHLDGASGAYYYKAVAMRLVVPPPVPTQPNNKRQLVLLCKVSDNSNEPYPWSEFDLMVDGPSPHSANSYWSDVSYGNLTLNNSDVAGSGSRWLSLSKTASQYAPGGALQFDLLLNDAIAAANTEALNFPSYDGIVIITNSSLANGLSYGQSRYKTIDNVGKSYGVVWTYAEHAIVGSALTHEIGHSVGIPHSTNQYFDPDSVVSYGNPYDVMSSWYCDHPDINLCVPPHTVSYYKSALKRWIPDTRVYRPVYEAGTQDSQATVTIDRISRSPLVLNPGKLMAQIPIGSTNTHFYVAEARRRVGFDANVLGEGIVIYKIDTGVYAQASLIDGDGNHFEYDGGVFWVPGETFVDAAASIKIEVLGFTTEGFEVRISTGGFVTESPPLNDFAISLDGTDYARTRDSVSLSPASSITVEAWIKPSALDRTQVIVSKHGPENAGVSLAGGYELSLSSANELVFATFGNAGNVRGELRSGPLAVQPHPLSVGQWNHVSGSYDYQSGVMRVSINGDLWAVTLPADARPANGDTSVVIGRAATSASGTFFYGSLDEIRICDRAVYTASGFELTYVLDVDIFTRALWRMNEGGGGVATDLASGNTATLASKGGGLPVWVNGVTVPVT